MEFFRYKSFCLCPRGGALPAGAVRAEEPFSPLLFLVSRDPLFSRGFFAIRDLSELDEPEGTGLLTPTRQADPAEGLGRFVAEHGASVVNTAFSRWEAVVEAYWRKSERRRVSLVGLGNVGGTTAIALKLLGSDLETIALYDANESLRLRYEGELNQVLPLHDGERLPQIVLLPQEQLFSCEAVLFTAARSVPEAGQEQGRDVRMMQYEANRELLRSFARQARETNFTGLFAQISDPVDQLSRAVFLMSNQNGRGEFDWNGLLPEQVRGFGLGVMHARAIYYAGRSGADTETVCTFGPHGKGLVVANAPDEGYDEALSLRLTRQTEEANVEIRKLGYKPYLAPGISSAAVSVLRALRGEWHDAAVPLGGAYFGCRSRLGENGPELLRTPLHEELIRRIELSYGELRRFDARWAD